MLKNNKILLLFLNWLIYLLPLFYIVGNFPVNLNVTLITIIGFIIYRWKIFDYKKDSILFLLSFFFLLIIIFSIIENIINPGNIFINKSVIFLRYFFFALVIRCALIHNNINLKKFLLSCFIFSIIISLDVILQFSTGKNLIGLESPSLYRSSFFGNEYISGGYIQRFSILGFFSSYLIFKKKNLKIIVSLLFLILCFFGTFYSGNKMPSLMLTFFLGSVLIFLFIKLKIYKNKIFFIPFLISLFLILLNGKKVELFFTDTLKNTYYFQHVNTFVGAAPKFKIIYSEITRDYTELEKYKGNTWFHFTEEFKNKSKYRYISKQSTYNHVYITALDLFLERPFIGRGIKSFRETCKEKVHLPNRICSTHQHNYHLQILNDTGLLGYLVFFGLIVLLIIACFKKKYLKNNIYFYSILCVIFIELFPIRSTGGFFSTMNSSFIFLMIGILLGLKKIDKSSKIIKNTFLR